MEMECLDFSQNETLQLASYVQIYVRRQAVACIS
jgi:hypothetical protein